MVLMVGKYNVSCEGKVYGISRTEYEVVNIFEFDQDGKPVDNQRKTVYIRTSGNLENLIRSEEDVRKILSYPNYSKLLLTRPLEVACV
ncbi:MAG: hypothetical protein LIP12_10030 [Clostridiales bacterium]|nr:hypothetical protein [Clostridiales bacterium]